MPDTRVSGAAAVLALVVGVVAVVVAAGASVYFLSEWVGDRQGPDGRGAAVAGLVIVYPRYAVAVVPLPDGKGRTRSLYYDGTIRETSPGHVGRRDARPAADRRGAARHVVAEGTQVGR